MQRAKGVALFHASHELEWAAARVCLRCRCLLRAESFQTKDAICCGTLALAYRRVAAVFNNVECFLEVECRSSQGLVPVECSCARSVWNCESMVWRGSPRAESSLTWGLLLV
eukprot:7043958-Pyramimonas_sp.AAC.1